MFVLQHDSVPFIEGLWGSLGGSSSGSGGLQQKQKCNGEEMEYRREKEKWGWKERDEETNAGFMASMVSHTSMVVEEIVRGLGKWGGVDGLGTLVDVGGNEGQVAGAIANAFPHLKCSVLEPGHVVDAITNPRPLVTIVKGDMFQSIPKSDVVFMKFFDS
ncbi:hypothetical protein ACLOJK_003257 [Asimina triloba]